MERAATKGWLRGPSFDLPFLVMIPVVAIAAGYLVQIDPYIFAIVLLINLWLLGYHHVIATYTRIAFSIKSIQKHRFLVLQLPIIVLGVTILATITMGPWVIATTYLYWQWFHYTRQSYGIARFYMAKSGTLTQPWRDINTYALYLIPLTGILYRSYQNPETFLFLDVKTFPVAYEIVVLAMAASGVAIALQIKQWIAQYRQHQLSLPYVYYMITHHIIFAVGYLWTENINYGWIVLNIWHNAQYIGFVWLQNNNRFKRGIDLEQKFISTISQDGKFWTYVIMCLCITAIFYAVLRIVEFTSQLYTAIPMVLVIYMTVNFHHYIVDAIIWKKKKKSGLS